VITAETSLVPGAVWVSPQGATVGMQLQCGGGTAGPLQDLCQTAYRGKKHPYFHEQAWPPRKAVPSRQQCENVDTYEHGSESPGWADSYPDRRFVRYALLAHVCP